MCSHDVKHPLHIGQVVALDAALNRNAIYVTLHCLTELLLKITMYCSTLGGVLKDICSSSSGYILI